MFVQQWLHVHNDEKSQSYYRLLLWMFEQLHITVLFMRLDGWLVKDLGHFEQADSGYIMPEVY